MMIKIAILLQCILLLCTQSVRGVNIEMVTVGNPGNMPDTRYSDFRPEGYGAVNYVYQIGKFEITAGQYTEFLNAVGKDDLNRLYNQRMVSSKSGAQIQRNGVSPNYSYSVAPDWANRPVNFVSFWDAARFCNWLHNGQPTGPQGLVTTEDGAYHDVGNINLVGRNPDARFFIPTYDEWYKAGYHNKAAGLRAEYFEYPAGSNSRPGNDITETMNPGNNANIVVGGVSAIGEPYWRTLVGEFEVSDSPYGTFDQGGNVAEWSDTNEVAMSRTYQGGSYLFGDLESLNALAKYPADPSTEIPTIGFRIAAAARIPEPISIALLSMMAAVLGGYRFRARRSKSS